MCYSSRRYVSSNQPAGWKLCGYVDGKPVIKNLLIVANPGVLRDGLHALVTAIPQTCIIGETDNLSMALETVSKYHPHLVLLAGNIGFEESLAFLHQVKSRSPQTRRLILVDSVVQKQEIEVPGVEAVWVKGTVSSELVADIKRLLMPSISGARAK